MLIRSERPDDVDTIHAVNAAAFETPAEADLVDALRLQASPIVSLVAVVHAREDSAGGGADDSGGVDDVVDGAAARGGEGVGAVVVGHILFSPVTLAGRPDLRIMGLAPMAVLPDRQHQGIGSALVRDGLAQCRRLGFGAVCVLGHAAFYPRFGFVPASRFGLRSEYDVPDDVFMVLELDAGSLRGASGTLRYHPAFASV